MRLSVTLLISLMAAPLAAQQDQGAPPKFRLGLLGFAAQIGVDFEGNDQLVVGSTLDLAIFMVTVCA
jgi:hypothetical protein